MIPIKATGQQKTYQAEQSSGCITAMVGWQVMRVVLQSEANGTEANGKWERGKVTVFNMDAIKLSLVTMALKSTRANGLTIIRMDPDV